MMNVQENIKLWNGNDMERSSLCLVSVNIAVITFHFIALCPRFRMSLDEWVAVQYSVCGWAGRTTGVDAVAQSTKFLNLSEMWKAHAMTTHTYYTEIRFGDLILYESLLGKTFRKSHGTGNRHGINKALFFKAIFR